MIRSVGSWIPESRGQRARVLVSGFSLVELLVVVAIIGILVAMYASSLTKAKQAADRVAYGESLRQRGIGNLSTPVTREGGHGYGRVEARAAFRQTQDTGNQSGTFTTLLYQVRDDDEFRAYWHTLINPDAQGSLEFNGASLVAHDSSGEKFILAPLFDEHFEYVAPRHFNPPIAWEYLSTNMADMNSSSRSISVVYADGHLEVLRYPGKFPASRTVAELSHRFLHPQS